MKVIEPGHVYELKSYDGDLPQTLQFMKREGDMYPGNAGHHAGTNCQEVLRALIDRINYLHNQIYSQNNMVILAYLRGAIFELEERAARRHGRQLSFDFCSEKVEAIETLPTCEVCGHLECREGH